uniref:SecA family profile domain-containing protein n=1 Tax=Panagrolaimus davidi TaxID=227884 RepID=A0A914QDA1_9BILA
MVQRIIVIATPLATRGTNIKLSESLIAHDGLHVILAFLPKNIRIEEQAFGRAARSGERGTAQLIVCDKSIKEDDNVSIIYLKLKRNTREHKRIEKMQNIYETKISVEEECLTKFGQKYLEIEKQETDDKFAEILLKDLRDRWSLFLDKSEYEYNEKEKRLDATDEHCKDLIFDRNIGPSEPINILNYAMKNNKFGISIDLLKKVGREFPAYLPEAQYYRVFIITKTKEEQKQFKEAEKELCQARNGFLKRLFNYEKNINIVKRHKVAEENSIFECDLFILQQKESEHLMIQLIGSIDDFFGRIITPFSFVTNRICEEASMFLFKRFSDSNYYKDTPICGFKINKDIDQINLENYCRENGLFKANISQRLKNLEKIDNINLKTLQLEMQVPKWEDFWLELKENECFTDEKEHMFVNILKLPLLSASKVETTKYHSRRSVSENRLFEHFIFSYNDEEFVSELIENEIIERTNVSLTNLNKVTSHANIIREGWEKFWDTEAKFNILDALKDAESFIETIFGKENVRFSLENLNIYQKIFLNPDVAAINETFNSYSAKHDKFSTFDATMVPLEETNIHESETSYLMITHGITHLLHFHDKKWTKKAIVKSALITVGGIAELGGGIALGFGGAFTGPGAVPAAVASKVLFFEGVSDILFGLKGFATGFSDNYLKHKITNLGMNVAFCGAAEGLKFLKFAHEFSLAKTFVNPANAGVNAGTNLTKHAFEWLGTSLFHFKKAEKKYLYAQKATDSGVQEIYNKLNKTVDNIFASNEVDLHNLFY